MSEHRRQAEAATERPRIQGWRVQPAFRLSPQGLTSRHSEGAMRLAGQHSAACHPNQRRATHHSRASRAGRRHKRSSSRGKRLQSSPGAAPQRSATAPLEGLRARHSTPITPHLDSTPRRGALSIWARPDGDGRPGTPPGHPVRVRPGARPSGVDATEPPEQTSTRTVPASQCRTVCARLRKGPRYRETTKRSLYTHPVQGGRRIDCTQTPADAHMSVIPGT